MKIVFKELYSIVEGQNKYDAQEKRMFDLTLLLVKNTKIAKAEIETFEEVKDKLVKSDDFVNYQQERQKLIDDYRLLDKDGKPISANQNGQQGFQLDPTKLDELQKKLIEFDKPHKTMLDEILTINEEASKKLNEEVDIPLKKITKIKHIEALSLETLVLLAPIVNVKLTEKMLIGKKDQMKASELDRILDFCEIG